MQVGFGALASLGGIVPLAGDGVIAMGAGVTAVGAEGASVTGVAVAVGGGVGLAAGDELADDDPLPRDGAVVGVEFLTVAVELGSARNPTSTASSARCGIE